MIFVSRGPIFFYNLCNKSLQKANNLKNLSVTSIIYYRSFSITPVYNGPIMEKYENFLKKKLPKAYTLHRLVIEGNIFLLVI